MKKGTTYASAGVDIEAGNQAVNLMKEHVKSTFRSEVLGDLGGFGGLFQLKGQYEEPVLVAGTDGVGTKLRIAFEMNRHDTIGVDAVAMCVNDILVQGAEPLFFLDYLAVGKLEPEKVAELVKGVANGCKQSGCALIGGETAEMPGFYKEDEYDIAGFAVGIVDKKQVITGETIKEGDIILGLGSSGVHSNGYSLVRKILEDNNIKMTENIEELNGLIGEVLLTPTKIYVKPVLKLLKQYTIKGMAHITGGGLTENIPRILPAHVSSEIHKGSWQRLPIFNLLQELGAVDEAEMYKTFNMGIGFILVVKAEEAPVIKKFLLEEGEAVYEIGKVVAGDGKVIYA
jgi:phosphoribosylformylglycinamidine cyclo-ligase